MKTTKSTTTKDQLRALFIKAQKNEQEKSVKSFADDRFLKFKIGNTYTLRLLFCPGPQRTTPFIEQRVHRNWNANLRKYTRVVCASSPYIGGYEGYKSCPICQAAAGFYPKKEAGDANAKIMYDTAKAVTENFAVVYVVDDGVKDEEQSARGKIKIIKYGFDIQKVLDMYVMGKEVKGSAKIPDSEIVGFEAFDLEAGRNLLISVSAKKAGEITFPNYTASFSTKLTAIPLTEEDVEAAFKELRFDEDFYVSSDPKAINAFYKNFILKNGTELDIQEDSDEDSELSDDTADADEVFETKSNVRAVGKKTSNIEDEEDEEDEEDDLSFDVEDDDEDEEPVITPAKKQTKKITKKPVIEDDEDDEDFADFEAEEPAPAKKKTVKSDKKASTDIDEEDWNLDF